jgi:phenylalanyl-tRNA synthetase alpha chain
MPKHDAHIAQARKILMKRLKTSKQPGSILRAKELKELYALVPKLPDSQRAAFGRKLNALRDELAEHAAKAAAPGAQTLPSIDVTAPFDVNVSPADQPRPLPAAQGTVHPLMSELSTILDIFVRMGFTAIESRQLDDDYHMFTSLNFPAGHPARDDYDSFMTTEGLIAPAHTSTMQNRILRRFKPGLKRGEAIRAVIPGRVFRNEDLDARHEHTFYQLEGVYVDRGIHAGHLIATLKAFLEEYYAQTVEVKTQPYYFPFTEPSFEFALSCPFCQKKGCSICSRTGWIELLGCGLIHPNVLKEAGIDASYYTGFAWGGGIDRLVMMKHGIEDIRHFHSGRLDFLRQFS